jgi:pimeloyl-ACP methyl ester carboxylesterase
MDQDIQFCTTSDNVSIAFAKVGSGPPLVKAANWMNHLELDWNSPVWQHLLTEFSRDMELIRYDERGTGLSDRNVADFSLDAFVSDLESIVDTLGLDRFPLLGISQGGTVAIAYAKRHPERVSHLILYGAFAIGWKKSGLDQSALDKRLAELTLIRQGWHSKNPAIRKLWTTLAIPEGRPDECDSFNELQRESVSAETAARIFEAIGDLDVSAMVPNLDLPVLVLHSRGDSMVPFEEGRRLASMIPGAKFVSLDSRNHLLLHHEPAWRVFVSEVRRFIGRQIDELNVLSLVKTCPTCLRTYSDDSLLFCLDDGSKLIGSGDANDEPVTILLS